MAVFRELMLGWRVVLTFFSKTPQTAKLSELRSGLEGGGRDLQAKNQQSCCCKTAAHSWLYGMEYHLGSTHNFPRCNFPSTKAKRGTWAPVAPVCPYFLSGLEKVWTHLLPIRYYSTKTLVIQPMNFLCFSGQAEDLEHFMVTNVL